MSFVNHFRLRPDLVIQAQDASCGTWVVKDPVSLRFFLFGGDEHFILERLDGRKSSDEILDDFARERAPKRMTAERLHAFLASLHRNGLACSDASGQSQLLLEREAEQTWRERVLGWTNFLAIRFPGFNPDAALNILYPLVRWCFSLWCLSLVLGLFLCAISVVVAQWDWLWHQWPRWDQFIEGRNVVWLGVALVITKCLHELAHAVTCKHFGGKCHEMGIILLVFTPCLYCNVTDAWMLRSRWQRIAISAAGMIMEVFLASLAVLLWRITQPGALNSIAFNVILVCGLSTLLFNGNPLLKYDGYYILSDLLRMPNLWQESRAQFYGMLSKWLFGGRGPEKTTSARRGFLLAYAGASIVYRICLTLGILLFLYRILHPQGFDLLLMIVVASIVGQSVASWATHFAGWWRNPLKFRKLKKGALFVLIAAVTGLVALVSFIPFPCRVAAPAVLQPSHAKRVYVATPGAVVQTIDAGQTVAPHDILAVLENVNLQNERLAIGGDKSRAEARVRTLELRLNEEAGAAAQLLVAQEILADLVEQARLRDEETNALTIKAVSTGTVIAPPVVSPPADNQRELASWSGTPLDPDNRGCYVERGTLLCLIGDPQKCEAVILVDETDVPYVRVGQSARIRLEHALSKILTGQVVEIAEVNVESAPPELVSQHEIAVQADSAGAARPIRSLYQVRVAIEASDVPLLIGARASARIQVEPQTIAQRVMRWLSRTLTIEPKG